MTKKRCASRNEKGGKGGHMAGSVTVRFGLRANQSLVFEIC